MPADSPGETSSPGTRRLTWMLAGLAILILEIAIGDGDRAPWMVSLIALAELGFAAVANKAASQWDRRASVRPVLTIPVVVLTATLLMTEGGIRSYLREFLPLEQWMLCGLRNLVLVLLAWSHRAECRKLAGVFSTFLVIFASAISALWWLHGMVVIFAAVGVWWLMGAYWDTLRPRMAAHSDQSFACTWWFLLPLLLLPAIGVPVAATSTHALRGFMPSSGGQDWYSESSRGGVHDGDALVAGTENIQSIAPIENAPFLSSHEPSLYDMFDDTYNEAVKPKSQDRAIAIPKQTTLSQKEQHLPTSEKAGRQFSTLRKQGRRDSSKIGGRSSEAAFYVKGRTPLHLKIEVFDRYNGIEWLPEEPKEVSPPLKMETLAGRPWLRIPSPHALEIYGSPETHALKIIRFDNNRIPSPVQLLGIHIDKVDRPDMFQWAQPEIIRMDRFKLPELTAIHVQSRVVDDRKLPRNSGIYAMGPASYREFGSDSNSLEVRRLVERWVEDVPSGWSQIEAVTAKIRSEYVLDREFRSTSETRHTAARFLLHDHRGPDYQFASATAYALRALGYSTRLASGFYVRPDRYEVRSRHTPVLAEDVHVWLEVFAGGDNWIPVEPSPGYELLAPPPTLWERIGDVAGTAARFFRAHAMTLVALTAIGVVARWFRAEIFDAIHTTVWKLRRGTGERQRILQTLQLLDRRCRRCGCPRPPGRSLARWLPTVCRSPSHSQIECDASLRELLRIGEWAAYAPPDAERSGTPIEPLCHDIVRRWSLSRLKRATPMQETSA